MRNSITSRALSRMTTPANTVFAVFRPFRFHSWPGIKSMIPAMVNPRNPSTIPASWASCATSWINWNSGAKLSGGSHSKVSWIAAAGELVTRIRRPAAMSFFAICAPVSARLCSGILWGWVAGVFSDKVMIQFLAVFRGVNGFRLLRLFHFL